MASRILIMGLICIVSTCCLASLQVQKQEASAFDNHSFDEVWNAAVKALKDMEFAIKESDKGINLPLYSEQNGFIHAKAQKKSLLMFKSPELKISIKRQEGKIMVDCQAIQPGQPVDYGKSGENIKLFFENLKKNLDK